MDYTAKEIKEINRINDNLVLTLITNLNENAKLFEVLSLSISQIRTILEWCKNNDMDELFEFL